MPGDQNGIYPIAVQVKLLAGVVTMNIVGLGDQAVKEAKDRIESALDHLRLEFPKKKIVVNLSPSDIKKSGAYLDLLSLIPHYSKIRDGMIVNREIGIDKMIHECQHFSEWLTWIRKAP